MLCMFGDITRGEVHGDCTNLSLRPLRGVHWRVGSTHHSRGWCLEADATVRHEKHGGDHHVRPHVTHRHDTEKPRCIHTYNRREFISGRYVDYCDSAGICHVYTAPAKPQQNAVVGSAIWRVIEGGHVTRHEIRCLFPGVDLATIPNIGVDGNRLWHEAVLRAADCFNRSATKGDTR